ncbi:MAG: FHA domain-containing protein [Deltaproteobacteria bacterium]|nr:FHA domain-containing protein [Deltaproteobacteria bacterium]
MANTTVHDTSIEHQKAPNIQSISTALLVAHAPERSTTVDRCRVVTPFSVGRSSTCGLTIRDGRVSKSHLVISRSRGGFFIEDQNSTNGTYVNGCRITKTQALATSDVIRVGRSILVFHETGGTLLDPPPAERHGIAGRFHSGPLIEDLRQASVSARHLLIVGPSGCGKELAARALAALTDSPLTIHNAARFASEEEASTTLFGVTARVFSGVDSRVGLIEQAGGGTLFLDEIHNLPERNQRALLRVLEDAQTARIGETRTRKTDVQFVMASNAPAPHYGLVKDLLARLRVVHVPALSERLADIPAIFDNVTELVAKRHGVDASQILEALNTDHYEELMLDGFSDENVRGLLNIADRIVTRLAAGTPPSKAADSVFEERFPTSSIRKRDGQVIKKDETASHYEQNKSMIIGVFRESGGNVSATERLLRSNGFSCSRRWLRTYLKRWGVK